MTARRLLPSLGLAVLLTACAGSDPGAADDELSRPPAPAATRPVDATEVDPALADTVEQAIQNLADHLDVPEADITVVSAQPVTWSDASLGCPQPGMRYAQVVTEGSRIVLRHDDRTYDYHAGEGRPEPFLCDAPVRQQKSPGPTIDRTPTGE